MTLTSLGKIVVPTPGTAVQFSATSIVCSKIWIRPIPANAGTTVAVGTSAVIASTLVGALAVFQKPIAGPLDSFTIEEQGGDGDPLDLSKLYVDATTANDGVLVGYAVE